MVEVRGLCSSPEFPASCFPSFPLFLSSLITSQCFPRSTSWPRSWHQHVELPSSSQTGTIVTSCSWSWTDLIFSLHPLKHLLGIFWFRGEIASSLQWTADLTVRSLDHINLVLSDSATSFATAAPSPVLAHSMPSRISRIWILLYIEGFPRTLGFTSFSGSGILTKSTFCPFNYASALSVRSFAYRVFAGVD